MDFSNLYINMCDKAIELQNISKNNPTDFSDIFYNKKSREFSFGNFLDEDSSIWLPRQDQLQQLLRYKISYRLEYINNTFTFTLINNKVITDMSGPSNEICYLKLVMYTNYCKYWISNDWQPYI